MMLDVFRLIIQELLKNQGSHRMNEEEKREIEEKELHAFCTDYKISPREREVVHYLLKGKNEKQCRITGFF